MSRPASERLATYKNWHYKQPSPEELSEAGFVWSPDYGRRTSPRLSCDGCPALVWILAENEHPGYWHLPGCEFSTSLIELSEKGWKKPAFWEIFDEPMGYDDIDTDFPPITREMQEALDEIERQGRQPQQMLDDARAEWTYKYRPLRKEKKEIRVLRIPKRYLNQMYEAEMYNGTTVKHTITPEQDNMPFLCTVQIMSLVDMAADAKFEALSYTWGPSKPEYPLYVIDDDLEYDDDDKVPMMRISPNLNKALRHLMVEDDEQKLEKDPMLYIWVDAICINQRDNEEKAWQVEMMYEIYQRASRTIVWLGPGTKSSDLAMEVLVGMRRVSEALEPFSTAAHAEGFSKSVVDMRKIPKSALEGLHPDDLELTGAFGLLFKQQISGQDWIRPFPIDDVAALFQRPYWSRIWILQEFAAAKDIIIVCGTKRAKDVCFRSFMETWDIQMSEMVLPPRGIDHRPWTVVMTRKELAFGKAIQQKIANPDNTNEEEKKEMREFLAKPENRKYNRNLRMLLQEAWKGELEATNPLDLIYALLNLASDHAELGINVDYTVSPVELYTQATRAIYEKGDLALMAYCNGVPKHLPSWVPNFTGERGWIPLREHCGNAWEGTSAFDASKGSEANISFDASNSRVLKIEGILVDTVNFVDVPRLGISVNSVTPDSRRHMVHWIRQSFDYIKEVECEAYPDTKSRKEAAWRTPILDHFRLGQGTHRAGAEAEKGYDALLSKDIETQDTDPALKRLANIYFSQMMSASNGTIPFRTNKGYIGIGPASVEQGDLAVVLLGCEVPFLLRKENAVTYRLVGEAYVHGVMFGELFEKEPKVDTFKLS